MLDVDRLKTGTVCLKFYRENVPNFRFGRDSEKLIPFSVSNSNIIIPKFQEN